MLPHTLVASLVDQSAARPGAHRQSTYGIYMDWTDEISLSDQWSVLGSRLGPRIPYPPRMFTRRLWCRSELDGRSGSRVTGLAS